MGMKTVSLRSRSEEEQAISLGDDGDDGKGDSEWSSNEALHHGRAVMGLSKSRHGSARRSNLRRKQAHLAVV